MNTIQNNVHGMNTIQRELGINVVEGVVENLIETLERKAYEQNKIHLLVNCSNMSEDVVHIGELEAGEDYNVITSNGTYETPDGDYIEFDSEEAYDEYIEENEIEDAPDWWDFAEYSDIYWNTFWRFNNGLDLGIVKQLGLPAIELQNGEQYMSISGCGMDMSFQVIEYQALTHSRIQEEYATASKLDWCKMNMSTERFKEMLSALGVNLDRVNEEYFENR